MISNFENKIFIFLAGLHRSGTSLLHEIIREHSEVSGFSRTGVPEDEGQHLQTVYEPAKSFGGPGRFAFDQRAYMNESHPLATKESAKIILEQWSKYYDSSRKYLIEKSPPNIIRSRFLQRIFPRCKFVVIFRHPIAVSYATQKWSRTSIRSLIEHTLRAYEIFLEDMKFLDSVYVLRYEDFVRAPQQMLDNIYSFLRLRTVAIRHDIKKSVNEKYFSMWKRNRKSLFFRIAFRVTDEIETRANRCGYSINNYNDLVPVSWLGPHNKVHEH